MSEDMESASAASGSAAVHREIEVARSAGAWMPWAAFFSALGWWGAAGGGALAVLGWTAISSAPIALIMAGVMCALLPGILIVMAGFMARESTRSARANAIVMDAAARLLSPSGHLAGEAETMADQMRISAASVDQAMNHALSALKAMSGELGDERLRVESVAYASADNARELAERLATERGALESLARDLRTQTTEMSEAIPRQAALMVEAAKAAGEEVAKADNSLEGRLQAMDSGTAALAEKLVYLDKLAQDASTRTQEVSYAIARVEEKLDQSSRTVDQAVRAGEMAAAAAGTSGDALRDAVSVALDGARDASAAIQQHTREASEEAARALAALRAAGEEAASSIRAAGNAARAETDIAERRLANVSSSLSEVNRKIPPAAPAPQTQAHYNGGAASARPANGYAGNGLAPRQTNGQANGHANGHAHKPITNGSSFAEPPVSAPRATVPPLNAPSDDDDVLFDGYAPAAPPERTLAPPQAPTPPPALIPPTISTPPPVPSRPPMMDANALREHLRGEPSDAGATTPVNSTAPANGDTAWGDILADIDDPHQEEPLPDDLEEGVRVLLERLQDSGIELPKTFRPKDKKKIAAAARKSDDERRGAVRSCAGSEVDRVSGRLRGNPDLRQLAEYFLDNEHDIALSYLEKTAKTGKNASPRLSAYLLIDAALA